MLKAAFVVQRYGLEVNGGAELQCRAIAERMARHWEVEVLTTCALDYMTWSDHYPPGLAQVNGVKVRRFRVDFPRTVQLFNRLYDRVAAHLPAEDLGDKWAFEQGPYSSAFLRYVEREGHRYDVFVFFTYSYGTTYFGLPLVGDRAILVPEAHDEPCLQMSVFERIFALPRVVFFNTPEEAQLVLEKFGHRAHEIVAMGIDDPGSVDPAPLLNQLRHRLDAPYLLYLGRIDESKGCGELFDFFLRYRKERRDDRLKLVLVGSAVMGIPDHPDIVPLGFLNDDDKARAIAGARMLVMPSPYESLSLVVLEAWMQGKPVLVNGRCAVLEGQCRRGGGGMAYRTYDDFASALTEMLGDASVRDRLGEDGRRFVRENYRHEVIERTYLDWGERIAGSESAERTIASTLASQLT